MLGGGVTWDRERDLRINRQTILSRAASALKRCDQKLCKQIDTWVFKQFRDGKIALRYM